MTARLFVAGQPGARRIALCEDDNLVEYLVERADGVQRTGDIYLGRAHRIDRALGAAFVDIGLERPGFLPLRDNAAPIVEGAALTVQATRESVEDKSVRLTGRIAVPGFLLVLTPGRPGIVPSSRVMPPEAERLRGVVAGIASGDEGFTIRRAAVGAAAPALSAEAVRLRALWRDIEARRALARAPACLHRDDDMVVRVLRDHGAGSVAEIVFDRRATAANAQRALAAVNPDLAERAIFRPTRDWVPEPAAVEEQALAALEPAVPLPSGGFLLIEPGRTLTAVDVNTGRDGGREGRGGQVLLHTNLEATQAIARQLRLRNIGGIVVADFIDLDSTGDRRRVVDAMRLAVADDPAYCWVGSMSRLGLVEMTRQRRGVPLADMLMQMCSTCGGTGRVPSPWPDGGEEP